MRPLPQRGTFAEAPRRYGTSVLGCPLEVWPAAGRCELLVVAGIHGEEPDTTVLVSRALRSLTRRPAHTAAVAAANPDGLVRGTRGNARNVDLNRNFPTADWGEGEVVHRWTSRDDRNVALGPGSAPASEPETAALVELIDEFEPACVVSLHGHLSCIEDPDGSPLAAALAHRTGLPLVDHIGYPTPGSMGTWGAQRGVPIITWELPPEGLESLYHSQLPALADLLENGVGLTV